MNISDDRPPEGGRDSAHRSQTGRKVAAAAALAAVVSAVSIVGVRARDGDVAPIDAGPHPDRSIFGTRVTVGTDVCGRGWNGGKAGRQTFAIWNNSIQGLEVYLQDVETKKVYLDVEALGSTSTRSVSVDLPAGRYRFYCLPGEADPLGGRTHRLTGRYSGPTTPGVVPVTPNDLAPALRKYLAWVGGQLPALTGQVEQLEQDVRANDRAAARRDWLIAHQTYETLGAAYDAFGDDDAAINPPPSTTTRPAEDKELTGFHRIEALLWSEAPVLAASKPAADIVTAVSHLRHDLSTPTLQTQDIGLRAHEILENAIEFELTGRTDAGSHTNLATIEANLVGTRRTLGVIAPVLKSRDPHLARTSRAITASQRYVRSFLHDGVWTSLDSLSPRQRQRLNALLQKTVEDLSEVAVITDPRKSAGGSV